MTALTGTSAASAAPQAPVNAKKKHAPILRLFVGFPIAPRPRPPLWPPNYSAPGAEGCIRQATT